MAPRTSSRAGNASSPPHSPNTRKRATRSQSADLGATSNLRGNAKQRARQGSADSFGPDGEILNKGKGAKRATPGLSAVNEEHLESPESSAIESIRNDQHDNDQAGSSDEESDSQQQAIVPPPGGQSFNNKDGINRLKAIGRTKAAQAGPSEVQGTDEDFARTQQAADAWENDLREKNKENKVPELSNKRKLTDAQPGAGRVSFETQEYERRSPRSSRKRTQEEAEIDQDDDEQEAEQSEDSGDGDFEVDNRQPKTNRKAKGNTPKRARHSQGSASSAGERAKARRPAATQGEDLGAGEASSQNALDAIPLSQQVRAIARANTKAAKLASRQGETQPQIRKAWFPEDEELLKELIAEYGCSWTVLQSQGRGRWKDEARSLGPNFQVQLKDKARNMKTSHLKAKTPMPQKFKAIRLGRKEVAQVQRVIPDYDQDAEDEEFYDVEYEDEPEVEEPVGQIDEALEGQVEGQLVGQLEH